MTDVIPTTVNASFKRRDIEDVLKTTTQAELAGRAADSVREDCFKQHVANVHELAGWSVTSNKYTDRAAAEKYFKDLWDKETHRILGAWFRNKSRDVLTKAEKKEFNTKSSPFRSMKSVVLGAVEHGAPLVDSEGMPFGKTALQSAIKDEKSPAQKMMTVLKSAKALANKLDDDPATLTVILREITELQEGVAEHLETVSVKQAA